MSDLSFWQKLAQYFENIVFPPHDIPDAAPVVKVTVRSGDSLWKISDELVGKGNRWPELATANADKNFDENCVIQVGEELNVPCAWLDEMAARLTAG